MARQTIVSEYEYEETYGYARAVRVGAMVFVSGTTARPPHLDGDAFMQAEAIIAIVRAALAEAGAGLEHVVRTVAYCVDIADAPLIARAHAAAFGAVRPASTLVQVAGLVDPRMRVEIEVTAALDA